MPERGASIADQTVEQLGGRTSILARQRADHARLDRLMARARETEAVGGAAHAVALRAVARPVFTHAFAEEAVLFPAARRALWRQVEQAHADVGPAESVGPAAMPGPVAAILPLLAARSSRTPTRGRGGRLRARADAR
jgi:hypothetical protein